MLLNQILVVELLALVHQAYTAPATAASGEGPAVAVPAPIAATTAAGEAGTTDSAPSPAPPVVSAPRSVSHGSFVGVAATTGALNTTVLASSIAPQPAEPDASTYPSDGQLHGPMPAPYAPAGGVGTNGTEPVYRVRSDFDYESIVRSYGYL